ncbi:MAG: hypothetical protein ACNFW9_02455 [Candidatus Kerfeldbacteria bacterium]|jgi:hypothetical protein
MSNVIVLKELNEVDILNSELPSGKFEVGIIIDNSKGVPIPSFFACQSMVVSILETMGLNATKWENGVATVDGYCGETPEVIKNLRTELASQGFELTIERLPTASQIDTTW